MDKLTYLKNNVFNQGKNHLYCDINFFKEIDKRVHLKNKKVLDIGCGIGKHLILYNLMGKTKFCWGIDSALGIGSTKDSLSTFQKTIQALNLKNIQTLEGDILTYNFGDNKFDVITAIYSVHHIIVTKKNMLKDRNAEKEFSNLFKKIANLLNEQGVFVLYEISRFQITKSLKFYLKSGKPNEMDYKTKHSVKEYMTILKKCGFSQVYTKYYTPTYYLNKFKFLFTNPFVGFIINSPFFIFAIKN